MVDYRPRSLTEALLVPAQHIPGRLGRSMRKKLLRRYGPRAVADFQARLKTLGPGDICLDLGANVGDVTEQLAATGATVHAFEPEQHVFAILQKRFAGRENVILHQAAVSTANGTIAMRRDSRFHQDPLRHSQVSSIYFTNPEKYDSTEYPVQVEAFADVVNRFGKPVAIVKMDIEGAEFDILEQVFANPSAFAFDQLFVETHERTAPEKVAMINRMRKQAARLSDRYINLFWP